MHTADAEYCRLTNVTGEKNENWLIFGKDYGHKLQAYFYGPSCKCVLTDWLID